MRPARVISRPASRPGATETDTGLRLWVSLPRLPVESPNTQLRPEEVETLFPFRIGFGAHGAVRELGRTLAKVAPELLDGARFGHDVVLVRPDLPGRIWIDLVEQAGPGQVLVFRLPKQELLLRGVLLPTFDEPGAATFYGSPTLRNLSDLEDSGLTLADLEPSNQLGAQLVQAETRARHERELERRAGFAGHRASELEARLACAESEATNYAELIEALIARLVSRTAEVCDGLTPEAAGDGDRLLREIEDAREVACIGRPGSPPTLSEFHPAELADALLSQMYELNRDVEFVVDDSFISLVIGPRRLLERALGTLLELVVDSGSSATCTLGPAPDLGPQVGVAIRIADAEGKVPRWMRRDLARPAWRQGRAFRERGDDPSVRLAVAQELLERLGAKFVHLRDGREVKDLELHVPWVQGRALRDQLQAGFPERVLLVGPLDHPELAGLQSQLERLRVRVRRVGTPVEALSEITSRRPDVTFDALLAPVDEGRAAWRSRFRALLMAAPRPLPQLVGLATSDSQANREPGDLLQLPVPELELVRRLAQRRISIPSGAKRRPPQVLLLEPDPLTERLARAMLKSHGADVDLAASPEEARRMHSSRIYDLILVDLDTPSGQGLELLRELRGTQPDHARPTILALSEREAVERQIALLLTGADGVLTKPLRVREDGRALGQWLHSKVTKPATA